MLGDRTDVGSVCTLYVRVKSVWEAAFADIRMPVLWESLFKLDGRGIDSNIKCNTLVYRRCQLRG